jgi:NAD(P)-dependent dehydrogenase (short-subunit alcohol dehydrogenase family)
VKHVVITGCSTGIGRAAAEELVAGGYHVFGSVRREADAADLQAQLGSSVTPLMFDVTDEAAVRAAAERVASVLDGRGLAGLVNNAGIGGGGPLMHQPLADVRRLMEVNVLGTLSVTQVLLPLLGARFPQPHAPGRIVNISSVAGRFTLPFLGAYAASKHALEALSDALRRELALYGIDVIVIEPGSVTTAIWDKVEQEGMANRYAAMDYGSIAARFEKGFVRQGRAGVTPDVVARVIRRALEQDHPKARYALPDDPLGGWFLPRLLPDRWLDRLIIRRVRLRRRRPGG